MKYTRSSKCHYIKWLTAEKQVTIKELLGETHRVVSWAVDKFHLSIAHCGMEKKHLLLASNLHQCDSWLTERAKKNCFAEAHALVLGTKRSVARFALGPYGAECKPEFMERHPGYYQLKVAG